MKNSPIKRASTMKIYEDRQIYDRNDTEVVNSIEFKREVYKKLPQSACNALKRGKPTSSKNHVATLNNIIRNCRYIRDEIAETEEEFELSLIKNPRDEQIIQPKVSGVRDSYYFQGIDKIEKKIKDQIESLSPDYIKKIKHVLSSPSLSNNDVVLCAEEIYQTKSIELLSKNKRNFGNLLKIVKDPAPLTDYKRKCTALRFNDEESIIHNLQDFDKTNYPNISRPNATNLYEIIEKEKQFNKQLKDRGKNNKLPMISARSIHVEKAKAAANSYFISTKALSNRLKK